MIDFIKNNKKICNNLLKDFKKDKIKLTYLNDEKKKIKDKLNDINNEIELLKDNKLDETNYQTKKSLIKSKLNSKNKLYKEKKTKKNQAKKILDELEIKNGNQTTYKTSALLKIKNTGVHDQIKTSIEDYVTAQSKKITTTNEKTGKQIEKTIQPDNNLVKNRIYDMIKDYYKNNMNTNINNNKSELNKYKKEDYELEFEKDEIDNDIKIYTLISTNYTTLITDIDSKIGTLNSNENTVQIQNLCNDEFDKLILISEKIKNILNNKIYDNTENKIYYHLANDDILNFSLSDKNSNFNYSHNNLSIEFKTVEQMMKNKNDINTYINILKNYFNKKNFIFIEKIKEINIDKDNEIKPFF